MKIDWKKLFKEGRANKGVVYPKSKGGQTVGIPPSIVFVEIPELDLKIQLRHRSMLKGYELCITLLELALSEMKYKF